MTVQQSTLFSPYQLGPIPLANRIVMAPMTRSRAIGNVPNALVAQYYGQRADAGLIVTEGTSPSPNGLGYARIPGLYSDEQVAGWKLVTDAVHAKGGKIFVQFMHTGRVGHALNLPAGAEVLAPSAVAAPGTMWTDQEQMQPHPVPRAMEQADIDQAIEEHAHAARRAIEAGFDGVELHGANGYLIEQFLNPAANQRTDAYGEDRNKFALQVAKAVVDAIGGDRVGIRLSPYSAAQGHVVFEGIDEQYAALAKGLGELGLAYVHVVDHSSLGGPEVPQRVKDLIRTNFGRTTIAAGGFDRDAAEAVLAAGQADLVAFGRPFISNPDLVTKLQGGIALTPANPETFYTPGEPGYTDY
jgi:N-ethylmaleimide reductase